MVTITKDYLAALDRIYADSPTLHQLVHGPATGDGSVVLTEGGPQPTVAKAIGDQIKRIDDETSGYVTLARRQADAAWQSALNAATAQLWIQNRHYGTLPSDPVTRPDGTPCQAGDDYFNSALKQSRVYSGGIWQAQLNPSDSSAVSFQGAAAGDQPTSMQEKARERKSVFDCMPDAMKADVKSGAMTMDHTSYIQLAFTYGKMFGVPIFGNPGIYKVTQTLGLECGGDFSAMTIMADGAAVSPVVRVGTTSNGPSQNLCAYLPKILNGTKPADGWGSSGIGLEFANVYESKLRISKVSGFTYGLSAGGYNSGCSYNTIEVLTLYGNKVNLRLKPASATGWSNENTYIGGRYGHNTSDTTNWAGTRDILIEHFDTAAGVGGPNNNRFIGASLESNKVEYMIDIMGSYNRFDQCRYEGTAKRVRIYSAVSAGTNSNLFIGGYQADQLAFTFDGQASSYNSAFFGRTNYIDATGVGINIVTGGGDQPHIQGFRAGQHAMGKGLASTDWTYRLNETTFSMKSEALSYPALQLANNGFIYFGDGTAAPTAYFRSWGATIRSNGSREPWFDNLDRFGGPNNRWSVFYGGSSSIVTSDATMKEQVRELMEAERRVAVRLAGLVRVYKFKDAVVEKGEGARWHVGVIAQDVKAAFEAEGLDGFAYGMLCFDEWGEEWDSWEEEWRTVPAVYSDTVVDAEGKPMLISPEHQELVREAGREMVRAAGSRYSVRYEELSMFIMAVLAQGAA